MSASGILDMHYKVNHIMSVCQISSQRVLQLDNFAKTNASMKNVRQLVYIKDSLEQRNELEAQQKLEQFH